MSEEAFDREFTDLDECLGAAMESIVARGWRGLDAATSAERPWAANLHAGASALLEALAERPDFAYLAPRRRVRSQGSAMA